MILTPQPSGEPQWVLNSGWGKWAGPSSLAVVAPAAPPSGNFPLAHPSPLLHSQPNTCRCSLPLFLYFNIAHIFPFPLHIVLFLLLPLQVTFPYPSSFSLIVLTHLSFSITPFILYFPLLLFHCSFLTSPIFPFLVLPYPSLWSVRHFQSSYDTALHSFSLLLQWFVFAVSSAPFFSVTCRLIPLLICSSYLCFCSSYSPSFMYLLFLIPFLFLSPLTLLFFRHLPSYPFPLLRPTLLLYHFPLPHLTRISSCPPPPSSHSSFSSSSCVAALFLLLFFLPSSIRYLPLLSSYSPLPPFLSSPDTSSPFPASRVIALWSSTSFLNPLGSHPHQYPVSSVSVNIQHRCGVRRSVNASLLRREICPAWLQHKLQSFLFIFLWCILFSLCIFFLFFPRGLENPWYSY